MLQEYYRLLAETNAEEFVKTTAELETMLERGCLQSEYQFLTHELIQTEVSDDGGVIFPDMLLAGSAPLISNRCKRLLDDFAIDNLFYKPILLRNPLLAEEAQYWLALPPRIRCLDEQNSQFIEEDPTFGLREAKKIVIRSVNVGNYQIFRISDIVNDDIIITRTLKKYLEQVDLTNIFFEKLEV